MTDFDDAAGTPIALTPYPDDVDLTGEDVDDLDEQEGDEHACTE